MIYNGFLFHFYRRNALFYLVVVEEEWQWLEAWHMGKSRNLTDYISYHRQREHAVMLHRQTILTTKTRNVGKLLRISRLWQMIDITRHDYVCHKNNIH